MDEQDDDAPVEPSIAAEELAEQIEAVAEAADKVLRAGLTRRALVLLIHDAIPAQRRPGKREISMILDAQVNLAALYLEEPEA